jgi:hypothetical protein
MLRLIVMAMGAGALIVMFLGQAAVVAVLALGTFLFALLSHAAARLRFNRSWAYAGHGWDRFPDRAARLGRVPRRMFCRNRDQACRNAWRFHRDDAAPPAPPQTGHGAFDRYREETLERLEQEAKEFQDFLARLRRSQDKAEFDQFLADRRAPAVGNEKSDDDDEA